jgi:hypothetical protein
MADITSTSTITELKERKAAHQADTIGQVCTRSFTVKLPNPANTADFVVIGKIPAGCAVSGVYTRANAAIASNTGIEYGISSTANGVTGLTVMGANVAAGVSNVAWTYTPSAIGANSVPVSANDTYLVATVRGNATAAIHTLTVSAICVAIEPDVATYSTFTI